MAGSPDKLTGTVKISLRYIDTGSSVLSPILNAELGVEGVKIAKTVFEIMANESKDPKSIIDEKGLKQQSDPKEIEKIVDDVIKENPKNVELFKSGKDKLFGFFVGQVMKKTDGKANPKLVNDILKKKLN